MINTIKRALGFKVLPKLCHKMDPEDSRDWHVDSLLLKVGSPSEVPTSGSVYAPQLRIKDQGDTGSCLGQSVANATRAAYLALGDTCPDLSALFIYYCSRALVTPATIVDNGAYLRDGIKTLQQFGECSETVWQFQESKVNTPPSWSAYRNAVSRRGIRGYYSIPNGDVKRIKRALAAKVPVVAGWMVDDSFMDGSKTDIQGPCTGRNLGGHAMMVESFEGDTFTMVNSWGTDWRRGGRFLANADFIATCNSAWAIDVRK